MIRIEPMTREDLPSIMGIERSSHVEPWNERSFLEELDRPQSRILVARVPEDPAIVAGYICFWNVVDEIHILNIAVHMAYRRREIGRTLLLHALKTGFAMQARIALLEVRRSNEAARRLYESLGFQVAGRRPNYYGGIREPAILMELEMDQSWKAGGLKE